MTYQELVRSLRRLGYEYRRPARGSHEVWWHPQQKRYTVVPRHSGKELATGTLAKILRDLGLSLDDLWNL